MHKNLSSKKYLVVVPRIFLILAIQSLLFSCSESAFNNSRVIPVAKGWAANSINTAIFRHNSVVSNRKYQYVAFYNEDAHMVLAKRRLKSKRWKVRRTDYIGNVNDAHNSISIMIDGAGFLHVAWDHHDSPLHYCRSQKSGGLELTNELIMTGQGEDNLSYPEFYCFPDGNLLFLYRDGSSGCGNLAVNYYDIKTAKWTKLQDNLIDGQGQRNAYWQSVIDNNGTVHLSWVWRESWDVASNHDICYAKSVDHGLSWQRSNGEKYQLPITAASAEYVVKIPQGSELINQTSMCVNQDDRPYIATYWAPQGSRIPQYHLVYHDGLMWRTQQISKRETAFSLSGGGTKFIPISRPQILVDRNDRIYLVFRDIERENRVSVGICTKPESNLWTIRNLTDFSVGQWEPSYDIEHWRSHNELHLFIQNVGQGDAEQLDHLSVQMVSILEWNPAEE